MTKTESWVLIALAGAGVVLWLRKGLQDSSDLSNVKGVTKTATAGQAQSGATVTTPIEPSKVAAVAPKSTLQLLRDAGGKVLARLPSLQLPVTTNRLQPNRNEISNSAASSSPVRPQYRPTTYAIPYAVLQPR